MVGEMKEKNIWCDNIVIDGDRAWGVGNETNALFSINLNTGIWEYETEMPDYSVQSFRKNQNCIQVKGDIYCFPDMGDCIWIYNIENKSFQKIEIENMNKSRLGMNNILEKAGEIYAISPGINKIIEINVATKKIVGQYTINPCNDRVIVGENSLIFQERLYFLLVDIQSIGEFSLNAKEIKFYSIPFSIREITAMCYDGQYFWLSGRKRELYRWNIQNENVIVLNDLPENFCVYDNDSVGNFIEDCSLKEYSCRPFRAIVSIEDKIWFIPDNANQILYVNRETLEINRLEVESDQWNSEENKRKQHVQYKLEYVKDNRYIGLYSFCHEKYLEIDSKTCEVIWKNYFFSDTSKQKLWNAVLQQGEFIYEKEKEDLLYFFEQCRRSGNECRVRENHAALEICRLINEQ